MSIKTKVADIFGLPPRSAAFNQLMYGVEVEYENMPGIRVAPKLWGVTHDGSLRNGGIEFVSQTLKRKQLTQALENLEEFLSEYRPDPSARCGIHGHLNCRMLELGQLGSVLAGYAFIEPGLFARFCPERESSSFCVPMFYNQHQVKQIHLAINSARRMEAAVGSHHLSGTSKYSALNTASLARFGTIEARHLPATLDFNRIREWFDVLTSMWDTLSEYSDPLEVVDRYEAIGPQRFLRECTGFAVATDPKKQRLAAIAATLIAGHEPSPERPSQAVRQFRPRRRPERRPDAVRFRAPQVREEW